MRASGDGLGGPKKNRQRRKMGSTAPGRAHTRHLWPYNTDRARPVTAGGFVHKDASGEMRKVVYYCGKVYCWR